MLIEIHYSGWLRIRGQKYQAKNIGYIPGFFALGQVRPTKEKMKSKDSDQPV